MNTAMSIPAWSPEEKGRILVVDDEPFNIDLLLRYLEHHGYVVAVVTNGYQALDMLRSERFDLVLLGSISAPGMSNIKVLCSIREHHTRINLPIVVLAERNAHVQAFESGADDCITQPFALSVALARVEARLRFRAQARSRVGELHKITASPRMQPRPTKVYCSNCKVCCYTPHVNWCVLCSKPRPREGWLRIEDSGLDHLGQTIGGRYFLEQFIGSGSVGMVYRAWDIDLGRDFAVKIIDLNDVPGSMKEELHSQILLEIEALLRLENPYIVKLYQVLRLGSDVYALVMDFVQGFSLEEVLDEHGSMEPWLVLDIVRQVGLALHAAHACGILHRDVKPGNIMLEELPTGEYFVRLLDFGIMQFLKTDKEQSDGEQVNAPCGTPAYISPEQVLGEMLDVRADIYSLGAVIFHMLVGYAPFEDMLPDADSEDAESEIMLQLQHQLHTPLPSLPHTMRPKHIVAPLNAMLQTMMAKEKEDRYQDMSDVLEQIMTLLDKT